MSQNKTQDDVQTVAIDQVTQSTPKTTTKSRAKPKPKPKPAPVPVAEPAPDSTNEEVTKSPKPRRKRMPDPHKDVQTIPLPVVTAPPPVEPARNPAKDGFALRKFTMAGLEAAMVRIRQLDGLTISDSVIANGTHQEALLYTIIDSSRKKLLIRFVKKSGSLQLQGDDKNPLFDTLAAILEAEKVAIEARKARDNEAKAARKTTAQPKTKTQPKTQPATPKTQPATPKTQPKTQPMVAPKTVLEPTIKLKKTPPHQTQSKKTTGTPPAGTDVTKTLAVTNPKLAKMLQKSIKTLRKLIPTAFEFMPEQCINDLAVGCADIVNNNNKLTDYSALLLPPFRGLEKFIFHLQTAKGIVVKLIGQAFDRDNQGKYVLKGSYTKRIGSVVFAEVMAALYTTYFEKRNYYSHSDYTDSAPRQISDRNEVQSLFLELLSILEYNSKKLKEIGFCADPN